MERNRVFSRSSKKVRGMATAKAYIVYLIIQQKVKFLNNFSTVMTCTTPLCAESAEWPSGLVLH